MIFSKYGSIIKETGLNEANRQHVHIRHFNRIEKTISIRHFAPMSDGNYIDEINNVKKAISELSIAEHNMIYITVLGNNLALLFITCKAKRYMVLHKIHQIIYQINRSINVHCVVLSI